MFTGQVNDLKDVVITQVSLGKAHTVALSKNGRIYTFGINNKGQCGREFCSFGSKEGRFLAVHFTTLSHKDILNFLMVNL